MMLLINYAFRSKSSTSTLRDDTLGGKRYVRRRALSTKLANVRTTYASRELPVCHKRRSQERDPPTYTSTTRYMY